jgi:hypothetical protein
VVSAAVPNVLMRVFDGFADFGGGGGWVSMEIAFKRVLVLKVFHTLGVEDGDCGKGDV